MNKDKRSDYDFLFEETKKKTSGADIALIILGALSIFFCFADWLMAIITSGIGLIISKCAYGAGRAGIGKTGLMFCKISICLAPSLLIIRLLLGTLLGLTILSTFSGILTL